MRTPLPPVARQVAPEKGAFFADPLDEHQLAVSEDVPHLPTQTGYFSLVAPSRNDTPRKFFSTPGSHARKP